MKWMAALVLAVVLVAAGVFLLPRDATDAALEPQGVDRSAVSVDASITVDDAAASGETPTPARDMAAAPAASPARTAEVPLREQFAALDAAARAGDAAAACRLGAEIERCATLGVLDVYMNADDEVARLSKRSLSDEDMEKHANRLAEQQRERDELAAHCAGLDPETVRDGWDYFALAAANGHVPSQLDFLAGEQLGPVSVLRDPSRIDAYRAHAAGYFMHVVEAGDLSILGQWIMVSELADFTPLTAFVPPAWRERGFINALVARLNPEQRESLLGPRGNMIGAQIEPTAAQQQAANVVYDRYFAASPPIAKPRSASLISDMADDTHRCDEPAR